MAGEEQAVPEGPDPVTPPARVRPCPECGEEIPAVRTICPICRSNLESKREIEVEAQRWGEGLFRWAMVLGGLTLVLGIVGFFVKAQSHAGAFGLLIHGACIVATAFWMPVRRTAALLVLSSVVGSGTIFWSTLLIVSSGETGPVMAGSALTISFVNSALFLTGLLQSCRQEGSTKAVFSILGVWFALATMLHVVGAAIGDAPEYATKVSGVGVVLASLVGWALIRDAELGLALPKPWFHALWPAACAILLAWCAKHYFFFLLHAFGPSSLDRSMMETSALDRVLFVILLGPVAEEVLFRGAFQGTLRRLWGPETAVLATALIFAFAHQNPIAFPLLFVGGLTLGIVRELSGSLFPAVLFHVLYNAGVTYL